jgi:hypothetical protein
MISFTQRHKEAKVAKKTGKTFASSLRLCVKYS